MSASLLFLSATGQTPNQSTYTFSSQSFGSEGPGRYIVVCVAARGITGSQVISSVTIGGVTASVTQRTYNPGNANIAGVAIARIDSSLSGDVVIAFNREQLRCAISVYRVAGIDPDSLQTSGGDLLNNGTISLPVNATSGGVVIGLAVSGEFSASHNWSEVTEDAEQAVEAIKASSASRLMGSSFSPLPASVNVSGVSSSSGSTAVIVSWALAGGNGSLVNGSLVNGGLINRGLMR